MDSDGAAEAISVVVAEDNPSMRAALVGTLSQQTDIDVVGAVADSRELRAVLSDIMPAVLMLDLRLGDAWGLDLVPEIKATAPTTEIVVLSAVADVSGGADGGDGVFRHLEKGCALAEILDAVRSAARHRRRRHS